MPNMLPLFCVVVGEGRPFAVKIDAYKVVGLLMDKILEKKSKSIHCDANKLNLYVAKTPDGTWLDINAAKAVALDEHGQLKHYDKMDPLESVNHYFNSTDLAEERIHVLVVVPDRQFGSCKLSNEEIGDIVEERLKKFFQERDEKVSVHSLSDMDSVMKQRLLQMMDLKVAVLGMVEPRDTSIPGYPWMEQNSENPEDQRAQYMTYLETHLTTLLDKFSLQDIASEKSILDTKDPRLPFLLKGTADSRDERQEESERKHVNQAIGQLVCASIMAPLDCYPMRLLTDLNGVWLFTYFTDKNVLTHVEFHYPKNAIDFIKATIVDPPEGAILPLPYLAVPFKKMRMDDFLPRPVDGHAAAMMENFELMADELEPEFLMARRMEYAMHLVQSIPMFACMDMHSI
ncbi:hypothetical protein AC1031_020810 [Aphanomyces cochlioides]|nr:hypothetical protein AC1031_020810 [Aphanomyces cochlioides]